MVSEYTKRKSFDIIIYVQNKSKKGLPYENYYITKIKKCTKK